MRQIRFSIIFLVVLMIAGCGRLDVQSVNGRSTPREQKRVEANFAGLGGTWLNEQYVKNIENKDYFMANGISVYRISFTKDTENYCWSKDVLTGNEEGVFTGLRENEDPNRYTLVGNNGSDSGIVLGMENGKVAKVYCNNETFVKLDIPEDDFINKSTMEGSYIDAKGNVYTFDKGETAYWPDCSFNYSFEDTYRSNCNIMSTTDGSGNGLKQYYGFAFVGKDLYLYDLSAQGDRLVKVIQPIAILKTYDPNEKVLLDNYEVEYIRFYESDENTPEISDRKYETRFKLSATRYVNWEMGLSYQTSNVNRNLNIYEAFYYENGSFYGDAYNNSDFYVEAGWTESVSTWGMGGPGSWSVGKYRVEVYINSKKAAEGYFEIYDDNDPAPEAGEPDKTGSGLQLPSGEESGIGL